MNPLDEIAAPSPAGQHHFEAVGASPSLTMRALQLDELQALQTPAYIYDPAVVMARYAALRVALGTRLVVSFKANSLVDLLIRCGEQFVDGVELASIGELGVVTGRIARRRFVNNPAMDESFLRASLVSGCDIIVDSVAQAHQLAAHANPQRPPRALLRLNAASIGSGGIAADHFGMDLGGAAEAARRLADSPVVLTGIHSFAGSQSFARHGIAHANNVASALDQLEGELGMTLPEINLGGGFEADWETRPEVMRAYREQLRQLFGTGRDLAHESGRGIFGPAGAFVTRVVAVKPLGERQVVVCDGGMAQSFLLAATEGLLRKPARPQVVAAGVTPRQCIPATAVQYAGSSCSRQDVIGLDPACETLPDVGDFCVFENCGAYHASYTVSHFLMLPAASPYLRGDP